MSSTITLAQIQAMRALAQDEPRPYGVLMQLCDQLERLLALETAALRFIEADNDRERARAEASLRAETLLCPDAAYPCRIAA